MSIYGDLDTTWCLVFNVGNYRRKNVGARQSHNFFDPDNKDAIQQRMLV